MKNLSSKQLMQLVAQAEQQQAQQQAHQPDAYEQFQASELYCAKCKQSMPVREKLLLTLPSGDLYDYICTGCGSSLGTRNS